MAKKKSLAAAGRRLTTLAVVFFFVNASLIGATGQAQALDLEECAKDVVTGAWTETVLDYVMGNPNYCLEITNADFANTSRTDQEAKWQSWKSDTQTLLTHMDNRLQDAETVALTKAKIAIVNELNNGSDRANATAAGREAIDDYYSKIEANLLQHYNNAIVQANYTIEVEEAETGGNGSWIIIQGGSNFAPMVVMNAEQIPLINGSQVSTHVIRRVSDPYISPYHPDTTYGVTNQEIIFSGDTTFDILAGGGGVDYHSRFSAMNTQAANARANIDTYVDAIYNNYSAGQLNTSDLLNPTEIYQEASTNRNSTGYQGWAAIQLASIGYGGDPETSHEIDHNGTQISGTLFYTGDDLTTIETGVEYDPANYTGSFLVAAQNGSSAEIVELTEPFTVTSATNLVTGAEVENTTMEKKVYSTTNASELEAELQALRELRQEYENQTTFASSGGGGGGGGGGFDLGLGLGSGGLVVGLVLVLAVLAARG